MVVVLEDGCGSSILVDLRSSNNDMWRNARVWLDFYDGLH